MRGWIVGWMLGLTLVACGSSDNKKSGSDDTLLGTDKNKDGIRDDVETFIQDRYGNEPKKLSAARQKARELQKALAVYEDQEKSIEVGQSTWKANSCLLSRLGSEDFSSFRPKLQEQIFNNPERTKAYYQYNRQLSGETYHLDEGEHNCEDAK